MLVMSVEVNKDTLACGVQPLDLITQLDGKQAEDLGDSFGQCNLRSKILMTTGVADAWIARMSQIPSMSDLQGEQLFTTHCLPHTVYCTLFTTHCLLHTVYHTLFTAHCLPHTVYCTLFTAHC